MEPWRLSEEPIFTIFGSSCRVKFAGIHKRGFRPTFRRKYGTRIEFSEHGPAEEPGHLIINLESAY